MRRTNRTSTWLHLVLAIGLAFGLAACGGDDGGEGCTHDAQCALGKVCVGGSCAIKGCDSAGECAEGQTCVDADFDGALQCVLKDCETNEDCADKAAEAGADMICEQLACLPVQPETPDTDVVEGDTSGDLVEADTAEPVTGLGVLCQACSADEDCGEGADCTPLAEGDFCTTPCTSNDECPTGFQCFQMTSEGKSCVPGLYSTCAGCLTEPCPAGQYCDQVADACKPVAGPCGRCVQDDECGLGWRCYAFSAEEQRCVPECGPGAPCAENAQCRAMGAAEGTEGVNVCVPLASTCCFGDECQSCDCSGTPETPYCNPQGECAECLSNNHCPAQKPKCEAGVCVETTCGAAAPFPCSLNTSGCCECTNDTHCTDQATPYCQGDGKCGTEQCTCTDPFPACLEMDGQIVCVECTEDADCASGCTCAADYTCLNEAGQSCSSGIPPAECTGCTADADCGAAEGFDLRCDATSGCCYDMAGKCDNVVAFCAPGSLCTGMVDMIGLDLGGLGGMIPGGGGDLFGDLPNYCACPPECLGGVACVTADEVADAALGDLGGILGGLLGDLGGDSTFCVDLASVGDLLGGLLGGGGLPFP